MKPFFFLAAAGWMGLWFTPNQQGQRHFQRGEYAEAAADFEHPLWQGVAWFRAGEFEKAARAFARRDTPEAHYNQGNAWLMNGKYEAAISSYERALAKRADWIEARENRDLAAARAAKLKREGGDMGDQTLGADEIRFDNKKSDAGQETRLNGGEAASGTSMQELWLRRVQTKPADFLRAKFSHQNAMREQGGQP